MGEATDMFLVEGCSAGVNGHGSLKWAVSVKELACGRASGRGKRAFTGRPALTHSIMPALRDMCKNTLSRGSFKAILFHLREFWLFLDEMDAVVNAPGKCYSSPSTVFGIPGVVWALFKDWLDAQANNSQHYTYFHCKRTFDLGAVLSDPVIAVKTGYPLPLNPFPNPQKVAARTGLVDDNFLEPDTIRAAAEALYSHVHATTSRIGEARRRAASGVSGSGDTFYRFAADRGWDLDARSAPAGAFAEFAPLVHGSGVNHLVARAWWFVPRLNDLMPAFCLVMLRTGWNTSTTLDMNAGDWVRDHPTRPAQLVQLVSAKGRARGRAQSAYSSKHKAAHPYQVIKTVLEWNKPLRDALRAAEIELSDRLDDSELDLALRQRHEKEINRLRMLRRRIWLYINSRGNVSCIGQYISYSYVNSLFSAACISNKGKPLLFSQELSRNTWAMFAYQTSGYNALVTKLALGHKDLSSLLHYINQKSIRNRHRREFFDFQSHVLDEVTQGRLHPGILRVLVERGKISKSEAEHLARGGTRTCQGVTCANPYSPDPAVVPDHAPGTVCISQSCLNGCSKAFATLDCLEYVARRILELRQLEAKMPLLAWTGSDHPHDLQFLEQLFERFSEDNRRMAIEKAEASPMPRCFTSPSPASLLKVR
ncbi:hypothetical protein [Paracoccus alkanivorans]|uniref:hypothetical protein n=1 Tax=Paracoccus alkanivorans TaxID=2116655 RepID=UPI0011C484BA|nr:hypothetical protein [Paracoccus alkanivorans]